ncbi:carbon storage regulator CsrA [Paenibacillus sp. HJL G12]|uniref:Translational regulator CsrA n=1 Tax=Paenibacillus dendrobii TaxID=2691084 RepID=A0A7X3LKL5_9BACL|nr:carbon storage regulator CsrA [Paenibacillus dendrobii]MWV46609.1 carbon storage regulator CsrA [Paenibacillus dendrobii]
MLVLTRKKGEALVISENIELTILGIEGDTVKIGVSAPRDIEIYRKEIYLSIQESNSEATSEPQELLRKLSEWKDSHK